MRATTASHRKKKRLRSGFTTGTAAAAASKAALTGLLDGRVPARVRIRLLTGDDIRIPVHRFERLDERRARATVIKDAGDDPDVTNGAEIGAMVTLRPGSRDAAVDISGGPGVGTVTKPGLEVPPGRPAINAGPQRMIRQAVTEVVAARRLAVSPAVEVYVPEGEALAAKTLNARLGIVGGISILGTTGIVRPMSHEAYTATIYSALSVARACGIDDPVLTTGRRSERFAQALMPRRPEEAFVQIGDYFKAALERAAGEGFAAVTLAVFFGKAVKMAQGAAHTHASSSTLMLERLAGWVSAATGDAAVAEATTTANTAREAFFILKTHAPAAIDAVGRRIVESAEGFSGRPLAVRAVIFDYDGSPAFDSGRPEGREQP